jgi:hypothetical protein
MINDEFIGRNQSAKSFFNHRRMRKLTVERVEVQSLLRSLGFCEQLPMC